MLTDVQMPVRDGYSTARAIRTETPWKHKFEIQVIPIIALTASAILGDKEKCIHAGMDVSALCIVASSRTNRA
jgi:CheY-like chemotaxis protein